MTWWMVTMSAPAGDEVRAQLGSRYLLLPFHDFECPWHRRDLDPDEIRRYAETTGRRYPPPACEELVSQWQHSVRSGALEGLPVKQLPDWRSVVFIPAVRSFGAVLEPEWRRIVAVAREARGPLLEHAYTVSLEILQRWKEVGSTMLKTIHERTRQIRRGESNQHPSLSFPRGDVGIPDWIFLHVRELYYRDVTDPFYLADAFDDDTYRFEERLRTFRPFEKAYAAVAAATGYTVQAVEKIVQVNRQTAIRKGAPDRRRMRRKT
jgi:hypothetical protein